MCPKVSLCSTLRAPATACITVRRYLPVWFCVGMILFGLSSVARWRNMPSMLYERRILANGCTASASIYLCWTILVVGESSQINRNQCGRVRSIGFHTRRTTMGVAECCKANWNQCGRVRNVRFHTFFTGHSGRRRMLRKQWEPALRVRSIEIYLNLLDHSGCLRML